MENISGCSNILVLPDLVLHHICSYISDPFDLLYFGNTCSRLRSISSSNRLWWNLSVKWLTGLWSNLTICPSDENPRVWLLTFLRDTVAPPSGTKTLCDFKNGEIWTRIDTKVFRCLLGMLQIAYVDRLKERHPAVLYERWLYDIGVFRREEQHINFSHSSFSTEIVAELAAIGQAKERDLRARKQPFLDPKYYIKVVDVSQNNWIKELFPAAYHDSTCPLLLDPFKCAFTDEVSGLSGLLICLSLVLEKYVLLHSKSKVIPLTDIAFLMRSAISGFYKFIKENLPVMNEMWGQYCLTRAVEQMSVQDTFDLSTWQLCLNELCIQLQSKALVQDIRDLIRSERGIDFVVDKVRYRWRKEITTAVKRILVPDVMQHGMVTRVNITDSDLIGGDNVRQEMSAAAFISNSGALVTWHLTGRLRY